jgi:hypothetical protein
MAEREGMEAVRARAEAFPLTSPSPCTQGEGWGGGSLSLPRKRPPPLPSPGVPGEGIRGARVGFILLIAVLAIAAAGKAVLFDTLDPDLFWHLRVADQLAALTLPHPIVDTLSFASIKTPWTPYSWLAELGQRFVWLHGGYRAAIAAAAIMAAGLVCLIAMTALEMSRDRYGRPRYLAAALATFVGEFLCLPYISFRPATFAALILAVIIWLLQRDRRMENKSRAVWLVPPLTALLANVHLYVVFAPAAVFGLFLERPRTYRLLLPATILASLMTPMLSGAIAAAWHYQFGDVMVASPVIAEMRPFWHGPLGTVAAAFALLVVVAAIFKRRELRVGEWVWLVSCTVLLLKMGRFSPIFAIFVAPTLAVTLPHFSNSVLAKPWICWVLAMVALLECAKVGSAFPTDRTPPSQWVNRMGPDAGGYPTAAADYVEAHVVARTHRIICEFTWGGYLEWRLNPKWQLLMDGRTQLYTADFWRSLYLGTPEERKAYLAKIDADAAVVPVRGSSFERDLIELGWKVVYEDDRAEVLMKKK